MVMIVEWSEVQSLNITHTTKFLGAMKTSLLGWHKYEACPESIQPFWTSQEPVSWPWYNLVASHRRPYCASGNSHSPTGLVSWQWDAIDSTCVLWLSQIFSLSTVILALGKPEVTENPIWAVGVLTDLGDLMFCQKSLHESCRMGKHIDADSLICSLGHCECEGHTVHKLSQQCLTADLLAPRESECSRLHS